MRKELINGFWVCLGKGREKWYAKEEIIGGVLLFGKLFHRKQLLVSTLLFLVVGGAFTVGLWVKNVKESPKADPGLKGGCAVDHQFDSDGWFCFVTGTPKNPPTVSTSLVCSPPTPDKSKSRDETSCSVFQGGGTYTCFSKWETDDTLPSGPVATLTNGCRFVPDITRDDRPPVSQAQAYCAPTRGDWLAWDRAGRPSSLEVQCERTNTFRSDCFYDYYPQLRPGETSPPFPPEGQRGVYWKCDQRGIKPPSSGGKRGGFDVVLKDSNGQTLPERVKCGANSSGKLDVKKVKVKKHGQEVEHPIQVRCFYESRWIGKYAYVSAVPLDYFGVLPERGVTIPELKEPGDDPNTQQKVEVFQVQVKPSPLPSSSPTLSPVPTLSPSPIPSSSPCPSPRTSKRLAPAAQAQTASPCPSPSPTREVITGVTVTRRAIPQLKDGKSQQGWVFLADDATTGGVKVCLFVTSQPTEEECRRMTGDRVAYTLQAARGTFNFSLKPEDKGKPAALMIVTPPYDQPHLEWEIIRFVIDEFRDPEGVVKNLPAVSSNRWKDAINNQVPIGPAEPKTIYLRIRKKCTLPDGRPAIGHGLPTDSKLTELVSNWFQTFAVSPNRETRVAAHRPIPCI